ncbi:MAG TPA: hypothetical protein VK982_06565 [Bacteroidales bacterium]|nr:hypothetical protein [Bacteroidales bacterium]
MDTKQDAKVAQDSESKNIAIIAYLTVIGLIIAFIMNSNKSHEFASFHIRQSLGLCITGLALGVVGMIPILGWLINIIGIFVLIYMWIMGLMKAVNGKRQPVPILGDRYEEWFAGIN